MSDITIYNEQTFESIKHINENGQEYWLARELQPVLEYAQWRRFYEAIERAKLACKNSGFEVEDHFADVGISFLVPNSEYMIIQRLSTKIPIPSVPKKGFPASVAFPQKPCYNNLIKPNTFRFPKRKDPYL